MAKDIGDLHNEDTCEYNSERFEKYWKEEVAAGHKEISFFRPYKKFIGINRIIFILFCELVAATSTFTGPLVLKSLTLHLAGTVLLSTPLLWFLVALLLVSPVFSSYLRLQAGVLVTRMSIQTNGALTSILFRKVLKLSNTSKSSIGTGQITNIFASDVYQVTSSLVSIGTQLFAPFQLVVAFALIYQEVGISMFTALVFVFVLMPIIGYVSSYFLYYIKRKLKSGDKRIKLTTEVLSGIRMIKYYVWEAPFFKTITDIRRDEMQECLYIYYVWIMLEFFIYAINYVQPILIFYTFTQLGNELTYSKAFTTITLFYLLIGPIMAVPGLLNSFGYFSASSKRISNVLTAAEVEKYISNDKMDDDTVICIKDANFDWLSVSSVPAVTTTPSESTISSGGDSDDATTPSEPIISSGGDSDSVPTVTTTPSEPIISSGGDSDDAAVHTKEVELTEVVTKKHVLSELNLTIRRGQVIGLVGSVASGKSSLLAALNGELHLVSGTVTVNGNTVYHQQQPYILNATIKENILFGCPFVEEKFQQVIIDSALDIDMASFPAGVNTEIGEKGITLSGGQQARLSMARCFYHENTDILLLDDPLSAVDATVGDILFRSMLKYSKEKNLTIVLATHQTHFLRHCHNIFHLIDGRLETDYPFEKLEQFTSQVNLNELATNSKQITTKTAVSPIEEEKKPVKPVDDKIDNDTPVDHTGILMSKEEKKYGSVPSKVYQDYCQSGGVHIFFGVIIIAAIGKCLNILSQFVLAAWGQASVGGPISESRNLQYLHTFAAFNVAIVGTACLKAYLASIHAIKAGNSIHNNLLRSILSAKQSFFDVTPIGRIVNRFSSDVQILDQGCTAQIVLVITYMAEFVGNILLIGITTSGVFIILMIPISYLYYQLQLYYRMTNTELKRLVLIFKSPVFAEFNQALTGTVTIRSFRLQAMFYERLNTKLNRQTSANLIQSLCKYWLQIRLDFIGGMIAFFVAALAVSTDGFISPQYAAMSLSVSFTFPIILSLLVSLGSEVEATMSSIERIAFYTDNVIAEESIEQTQAGLEYENSVVSSWPPTKGVISVDNVSFRYRQGPLVLKNITFETGQSEKLGIAGRTGSGKSSLIGAIFRMEPVNNGTIMIDGVNVHMLPLKNYRKHLGIIPQFPNLFSASIRFNLDPFSEFSDAQIWDALEKVELKNVIGNMELKLDEIVAEGGENFSSGQRQLISFARVILRKPKILILDEATSNTDNNTDGIIQKMIRTEFPKCTILTVAHRLQTIADSDRILVLKDGELVQLDRPASLLSEGSGVFHDMWQSMVNNKD